MTGFRVRTIASQETLGASLRRAREQRRQSIDRIASSLGIQKGYLLALEEGNYMRLPGEIYGRHFLRAYARYLGVSEKNCMTRYTGEYRFAMLHAKKRSFPPVSFPARVPWSFHMHPFRVAISLLIFLGVGYLGVILFRMFSPPLLVVEEPRDALIIQIPRVLVRGTVEQEAQLTINGEGVLRGSAGQFEEEVELQSGVNTIVVSAAKKHGIMRTIERRVFFEGRTTEHQTSAYRSSEGF